jgi:hypothetical protein
MDRETAKSYILYGMKATKFSPKVCMTFLPFAIIIIFLSGYAIAMAYYRAYLVKKFKFEFDCFS